MTHILAHVHQNNYSEYIYVNDNYITSVMEFTFLHKKFVNVDKLTVYNSEELNKYNQSCWDGKYDLNLCGFPFTSDNIILNCSGLNITSYG